MDRAERRGNGDCTSAGRTHSRSVRLVALSINLQGSLKHVPPSLTIEIEEEHQTIDPEIRDLRSHIQAEILEKGRVVLAERVKPEMHQSVILQEPEWALHSPAGTHPFSEWARQCIPICGIRPSCGRSRDRHSSNSPFWQGMETGLKSYHCKVFDKDPRANIPDVFQSWGEFEVYVNLLIKTRCIDNAKKIWCDIRPHLHFPTLEFRVCDMPMRLEETLAIAAMCQAIIAELYKLYGQSRHTVSAHSAGREGHPHHRCFLPASWPKSSRMVSAIRRVSA